MIAGDYRIMCTFMISRPVDLIWGNNLLIKSNKGGDLNADINEPSDSWGYFYIKVRKGNLNLTVWILE